MEGCQSIVNRIARACRSNDRLRCNGHVVQANEQEEEKSKRFFKIDKHIVNCIVDSQNFNSSGHAEQRTEAQETIRRQLSHLQ
jgi:hypothetical protein